MSHARVLFALLLAVATQSPRASATIRVGAFGSDTFHQAEAAAVAHVLEQRGFDVEFVLVPGHAGLFDEFFAGNVDIVPSVWLPDGHASYLDKHNPPRKLGEDYEVLGITSEPGVFFWLASDKAYGECGVKGINDLQHYTAAQRSCGLNLTVLSASLDSGLGLQSRQIVNELNQGRSSDGQLVFSPQNHISALTDKMAADQASEAFVITWFVPNAAYGEFVTNGHMNVLETGEMAARYFGRPNRGSTIVKPSFLASRLLDSQTLLAIAGMYVGNDDIITMDTMLTSGVVNSGPEAVKRLIATNSKLTTSTSYWFTEWKESNASIISPAPDTTLPWVLFGVSTFLGLASAIYLAYILNLRTGESTSNESLLAPIDA